MDFKILLLILCITFIPVQGAIPRCCIETSPVRKRLLKRVEKFYVQDRFGPCEVEALVLKVNRRTYCAPMWQKKLLEILKPELDPF